MDNPQGVGVFGFLLTLVALALTPLNHDFFLFVKRVLLVAGVALCMASAAVSLFSDRVHWMDGLRDWSNQGRMTGLFLLQLVFALAGVLLFDGGVFYGLFAGACCGSVIWLVIFR